MDNPTDTTWSSLLAELAESFRAVQAIYDEAVYEATVAGIPRRKIAQYIGRSEGAVTTTIKRHCHRAGIDWLETDREDQFDSRTVPARFLNNPKLSSFAPSTAIQDRTDADADDWPGQAEHDPDDPYDPNEGGEIAPRLIIDGDD